jgi:rhodanese-related sulfurtransferase
VTSALTPQEAASKEGALFLDVREPYEWDAGHIAGAVHMPIGQVQRRYEELDRADEIVVVCQVGQRSELVASFLSAQGYTAHNLAGGLHEWTAAGMPLEATDAGGRVIDGWARDIQGTRLDGTDE